jgi:uridine kinase
MLGDILLIEEIHKSVAESITKRVIEELEQKPKFYKYIVGISGESGSGKSEVSHSIARRLKDEHIRVKVLHTDNYYQVPPLLRLEWRKTKGIETVGLNEYDWNLIHRNIQDFKEERESMMPCIDIIPEQVDKLITDFKKIDLLVIDGLYAIKADGIDMRIFIDLTYQETKITQLQRMKEKMDDFRMQVLEKEHLNVASLKPMADVIINKNYQAIDEKTGKPI